jgi:hypothetical protein
MAGMAGSQRPVGRACTLTKFSMSLWYPCHIFTVSILFRLQAGYSSATISDNRNYIDRSSSLIPPLVARGHSAVTSAAAASIASFDVLAVISMSAMTRMP